MQKWEYLELERMYNQEGEQAVTSINGQSTQREREPEWYSYIAKLGDEGWELVDVASDVNASLTPAGDISTNLIFVFKRPKQ